MNKTGVPSLILAFVLWATGALAWGAPAGQVQSIAGDVRLISKTAPSKVASSGDAIEPGTAVETGAASRVVLRFGDGQLVALSSNSTFRLDDYKFDQAAPEKGLFAASFLRGAARFVTGLIGDRNRAGWRVDTPTATAGIRGTDFLLGLRQALYASVKSGSIGLSNFAGSVGVEAGGHAVVESANVLGRTIAADAIPAGLFTELETVSLTALGGFAAAGAAGGFNIGPVYVPMPLLIGVGVFGAAAISAAGGDGTTTSTPSHH